MSKSDNAVMALSRGMYGKHITTEQYEQLISMKNLNEIAAYLKNNTPYAESLEGFATGTWTSKQLDEAVNRYFFSCFSKLCRFEIASGQKFYKYYIVKTEINEILNCTMLILGGKKDDYLKSFSSYVDRYLTIDLFALAKADTLEEICLSLEKTPYKKIFSSVMNKGDVNYFSFESAFMTYLKTYQEELVSSCFKGKQAGEIRAAISHEYDVKFICNLIRIIRYYGSNEEMKKKVSVSRLTLFSEKQVEKLISCNNLEQLHTELLKTPYKHIASVSKAENIMTYTGNYLYLYYKKQLRFSQSPCVVMLSFLYLCKTEINNIVKIIEGNKYKIPQEEIRNCIFTS